MPPVVVVTVATSAASRNRSTVAPGSIPATSKSGAFVGLATELSSRVMPSVSNVPVSVDGSSAIEVGAAGRTASKARPSSASRTIARSRDLRGTS